MKCELTYGKDISSFVKDRKIHYRITVIKNPQLNYLNAQPFKIVITIRGFYADKNQQSGSDFRSDTVIDCHRCPAYPLNDSSHSKFNFWCSNICNQFQKLLSDDLYYICAAYKSFMDYFTILAIALGLSFDTFSSDRQHGLPEFLQYFREDLQLLDISWGLLFQMH